MPIAVGDADGSLLPQSNRNRDGMGEATKWSILGITTAAMMAKGTYRRTAPKV